MTTYRTAGRAIHNMVCEGLSAPQIAVVCRELMGSGEAAWIYLHDALDQFSRIAPPRPAGVDEAVREALAVMNLLTYSTGPGAGDYAYHECPNRLV